MPMDGSEDADRECVSRAESGRSVYHRHLVIYSKGSRVTEAQVPLKEARPASYSHSSSMPAGPSHPVHPVQQMKNTVHQIHHEEK